MGKGSSCQWQEKQTPKCAQHNEWSKPKKKRNQETHAANGNQFERIVITKQTQYIVVPYKVPCESCVFVPNKPNQDEEPLAGEELRFLKLQLSDTKRLLRRARAENTQLKAQLKTNRLEQRPLDLGKKSCLQKNETETE